MKILIGLFLTAAVAGLLFGQDGGTRHGRVEIIHVHAKSLDGNLEGDSPDRQISIYLPPGYDANRSRRYPVIYLLHGFTDSDDKWFRDPKHFIQVPETVDRSLASGVSREMIIAMPNAFTRYQGSMYSNSVTTGDWETFVAKELVAYVDGHYRTIAKAGSRGLAGHSMGGYGTLRIGVKFPEVFSSIYALSPCCLMPNANPQPQMFAKVEAVRDPEQVSQADFITKAMLASGAAWSPNPKKPPFFFDLPIEKGELQPQVLAMWQANAPLITVHQHISELKRLHAIAFDAGDQDKAIAATIEQLHGILTNYEIPHTFEIYQGNHVNHISDRIETKTLPFFSKQLQ